MSVQSGILRQKFTGRRDTSKLSQYYRNLINYAFEVRIFLFIVWVGWLVFFLLHYGHNILTLRMLWRLMNSNQYRHNEPGDMHTQKPLAVKQC